MTQVPDSPHALLAAGRPFADYVAAARQKLSAALKDDARAIEARAPFELIPPNWGADGRRRAALCFHGLMTSPFEVRDLAGILLANGLRVQAPLMPSHGGLLAGLLEADLESWIATAQVAVDQLAAQADEIVLCGHSTGAALALGQALARRHPIKGLILSAPALGVRLAAAIDFGVWRQRFAGYLPELHWLTREPEDDYARHNSCSVAAGAAVVELSRRLRARWTHELVPCPVQLVFSEQDGTVSAGAIHDFLDSQPDARHRALIFASGQVRRADPRQTVIASALAQERILDFSHTALPFRPDNPHYGRHGDYHGRILPPILPWVSDSLIYQGETTPINRLTHRLRRLHFNPHFDLMAKTIAEFVAAL